MATAVLFICWNRPMPGMETKAYEQLMTEGHSYLEAQEGNYFESMEIIALTPHSGDVNGCIVLFGDRTKLDELRRTDGFEAFSMKFGELFDGWGVIPGVNWEGIQAVMQRRGISAAAE